MPEASFSRYTSASLRRSLARNAHAPEDEQFEAAVLFADISGFTPLAARMAARGASGSEELTRHLNAYFGDMLRLVRSAGGDVEKFAGDALLALFPAEPGEADGLANAAHRAAACAARIARELDNRETDGVALGVHVGVAAGVIETAHIDVNDAERGFVLLGDPLRQIAAVIGQAKNGEVCLSRATIALLGDHATVELVDRRHVRLRDVRDAPPPRPRPAFGIDGADDALAARYVNPALRERLGATREAAWVAELRRITPLFVHLGELPVGAGASSARLRTIARCIGVEVERFDGLLQDILMDDKGLVAIVVYGVRRAHEDDAARAVRTGVDLHAALAALGVRASIGIATGRVFCGVIGDDERSELAVVGEAMNLAARLMGAADGGVLCAPSTASDAGGAFDFEAVDGLELKNVSPDFIAHRPVDRAAGVERPASAAEANPVQGRQREWADLATMLDAHQALPSLRGAILEGEAGIGKTTLVNRMIGAARAAGMRAITAAGNAIDRSAPYHAWRAALADMLSLERTMTPAEQIARIETKLATLPGHAPFGSLLSALLPFAPPETDRMRSLDGQARAEATRGILLALLADAARDAPLVVVVENANWLDSSSWALLQQIAARRLPVCLVLCARPPSPDEAASLPPFLDAAGFARITLGPLDREATSALIRAKLGVASLSAGVDALIHERAAGHPYFAEELAIALKDAGLLRIEGTLCVLAASDRDAGALSLPENLERVLTSRIDRLGEERRLAIKVAAVLGTDFSLDALREVYPIEAERARLGGHLEALCAQELLADSGNGGFHFRQTMIRDAAYALLSFAQRRDIHRAAAERLERLHAGDAAPPWPLLAYHWAHAGVAAKALEASETAGLEASRRFANREAVHFLRNALRFDREQGTTTTPQRVAQWELELGRAHRALGELEESRRNLESALARLDCPVPDHRFASRARAIAPLARAFFGGPPRFDAQADPAANLAVETYIHLANLCHYANDIEGMFLCGANATQQAPRAGPTLAVATLYGQMAHFAAYLKLGRASRRYRDAAHAIADLVNTPLCTGLVNQYTGHLAAILGDLPRFDRDIHRALSSYAEVGRGRYWEEALTNCAYAYLLQGDLPRALAAEELLEQSGRARDDSQSAAWGIAGQGRVLLFQGRLDEALGRFAAADASVADSLTRTELLGCRALALFRRGEIAAALEDAFRSLELSEKEPSTSYVTLDGYAATAETFVLVALSASERARCARAQEGLRRMNRVFRRFASLVPIATAQAAIWEGVQLSLARRPLRARKLWTRALGAAKRTGLHCDEAAALRWRARGESGAEQAATLTAAADLYETIGYAFEAAEARAHAAGRRQFAATNPWENA